MNSWTFRERVSSERVLDFLLCVVDIIDALNELKDADQDNGRLKAASSARRISISLRKVLLDGNGYLFKSCFADPNLHPLKPPSSNARRVSFVEKINSPPMKLEFEDGKRSTIQIPEYEQRTTILQLYGMRHESGQTFTFEMPFDTEAKPLKFKAWMNAKVLQIDDIKFTAKELLREVANNEGAHINDGKKIAMPDGSSLTFDNLENSRYKAVNAVKFGGLSYAQNFVIFTGLYIASRSRTLVGRLPLDENNKAVAVLCEKIDGSPTSISGRGEMENRTYHSVVLGTDRNVRPDSLGGYSTLLKIP